MTDAGIRRHRGSFLRRMRLRMDFSRLRRGLSLTPGQPHVTVSAESERRKTCCASTGRPSAPTSSLWQWRTGLSQHMASAPPVHGWCWQRLRTCPCYRCGGHAIVPRSCSRWMPGQQYLHGISPKRRPIQRNRLTAAIHNCLLFILTKCIFGSSLRVAYHRCPVHSPSLCVHLQVIYTCRYQAAT